MMLIAVIATLGITTVNAATINDDGKYTLILTSTEENVTIDGKEQKVIRFNVAEGETTVKLSELTMNSIFLFKSFLISNSFVVMRIIKSVFSKLKY